MTAHLTITYGASPASTASPTSSVASAAAGSTGGDGSLGFLAELVDQLLAGSAAALGTTSSPASGGTTTPALPSGTTVDPTALAAAQGSPQGIALIAKLTKTLAAVKAELDAGAKPDPDLLKKLGNTADALTALIAVLQPATNLTPTPPTNSTDPLAALAGATPAAPSGTTPPLPGPPSDPAGDQPAAPSTGKPAGDSAADQDLAKTIAAAANPLASLLVPPAAASAPAASAQSAPTAADPLAIAPAAVPPAPATQQPTPPVLAGIAQLTAELADVSKTVAETSPTVSQQIDALVQKLSTAQTNPQALAQLTGTTDTGGTSIDKLVQQLLGPTQPAPPASATTTASGLQLATPQLPLPIAPAATRPSTPDKTSDPTAGPSSSDSTSSSTPTITLARDAVTAKSGDQPAANDQSKPDAKLIAAATAGDSKPDKTDPINAAATATATAPTAPATNSAAPRVASAAYQSAQPTVNMGQVAVEIAHQAQAGASRFTIRLDPPDLGRVDVKMHVDATGNLSARLTVERSETLDMFQRDRGSLEKALAQAGVDGGKTNLEFSLKQNPFAGMTGGGDQRPSGGSPAGPSLAPTTGTDDAAAATASTTTLYSGVASAGGVNLFV